MPPGARRGRQYRVADAEDATAEALRSGGAALFTLPPKCTVARRPEQQPRPPRLWICVANQHRQCVSCAALGKGVRHCCARGHAGHPRPPAALQGPRGGARRTAAHTPGAGGTPSAKRLIHQQAWPPGFTRERPHKRGRVDATPPPANRMRRQSLSAARHGRAGTEVA